MGGMLGGGLGRRRRRAGGKTSERAITGSVCSVWFRGTVSGKCWLQLPGVVAEPCVLRRVVAGAVDETNPVGFLLGLKSAERLLGLVEGGLSYRCRCRT